MITIRTIHDRYARCCGAGFFWTDSDALTTFREGVGLVASDDDSLAQMTDVSSPLIPNQGLRYYCIVLTMEKLSGIQKQNLVQMTSNDFVAQEYAKSEQIGMMVSQL